MSIIDKEGLLSFLVRAFRLSSFFYFLKKPLLLLRIAKVAFYYAVLKKNILWKADLSLLGDCNLNCQHCFAHNFKTTAQKKYNKKELSTVEIISVIKECSSMGIFNFDFQGGEVLLHSDLETIIKATKPSRSYINIVTNGILFNEDWAVKLKRWGVDEISFSLDSYIPEEHDNLRNKPEVFSKLMKAIKIAQKYKFQILIFTTVTHKTLRSEGVRCLHNFTLKNNFIQQLFIGIPIGKWLGRTDILINDDDHKYMEKLAKNTKYNIRRDMTPHFFRSGCPAVKESFYMTPYGDILPCPFIHISLGNIRDHYLKDIIERALTIEEFKNYCPVCLIGEDKGFINKYGKKLFQCEESPINGDEILDFKTNLPHRLTPLVN
ncbi:MAG: radical SAM protein [Syntrophaceae bacterium]|nr:radical SAM protein [Syntrophaceae bacterium]